MLRDLHTQGLNISEISRKTGLDRKTVSKYLKTPTLPESKKRRTKESKLDNYKEYIITKLDEGPFTASRLFREVQEMGFTGKYTTIKNFVRKVRPKQKIAAVYRFETKPGLQAQVDWSEFGKVEIDGQIKKLYCFNMILGYSRMRYIEFTTSIDAHTLIRCHMNAFEYFGGYPEEILYDNMKQIVILRAIKSSDSKWNVKFEDFFRHYGFIPRLCRPYRAQTKGKIENTVGYVRRDFFLGGCFTSLQDINLQAMVWLKRINASVHGTTHEIPVDRLMQEGLKPIEGVPKYLLIREETRKISRECYISYLGNKYSAPYQFAAREATVHIFDDKLRVIVGGQRICEHEILIGSGRVSRNKEHFNGLLGDILNDNRCALNRSRAVLKFACPQVEERPLSVYEAFSQKVGYEQSCI